MHLFNKGRRVITYIDGDKGGEIHPNDDVKVSKKVGEKLLKLFQGELDEASAVKGEVKSDDKAVKALEAKVAELDKALADEKAKVAELEALVEQATADKGEGVKADADAK